MRNQYLSAQPATVQRGKSHSVINRHQVGIHLCSITLFPLTQRPWMVALSHMTLPTLGHFSLSHVDVRLTRWVHCTLPLFRALHHLFPASTMHNKIFRVSPQELPTSYALQITKFKEPFPTWTTSLLFCTLSLSPPPLLHPQEVKVPF
jgi:hypothetical protein